MTRDRLEHAQLLLQTIQTSTKKPTTVGTTNMPIVLDTTIWNDEELEELKKLLKELITK